jgi:hypothetical protein
MARERRGSGRLDRMRLRVERLIGFAWVGIARRLAH